MHEAVRSNQNRTRIVSWRWKEGRWMEKTKTKPQIQGAAHFNQRQNGIWLGVKAGGMDSFIVENRSVFMDIVWFYRFSKN
jgi:hypothetical protein